MSTSPVRMRSWWRFIGVEVDGVGEMRGQVLVTFVTESLAVFGQLGQFLGAGGEAFIERDLDLRGEGAVLILCDRDVLIALGNELLGDADGHGSARAVLAFGGPPGADVLAVVDTLLVSRVVQCVREPHSPQNSEPLR